MDAVMKSPRIRPSDGQGRKPITSRVYDELEIPMENRAREIATKDKEQRLHSPHSRYQHFVDYGDASTYRREVETVRQAFSDMAGTKTPPTESSCPKPKQPAELRELACSG